MTALIIILAACSPEEVEVTRLGEQEVQVEVTRLVEQEVTRVVEQEVEVARIKRWSAD